MTLHRDFNQIARAYLADGPSELADRVLEDALWQAHVTRQRRRLIRLPWRLSTMNNDARVAIVTVAVVIVGSIGLAVVSPAPSDTGAETPSPSGSPTPSAPLTLPPAGDTLGPIGAGRYALGSGFPVPITFDVPPGWDACSFSPVEQGVCGSSTSGVSFLIVENVAADPCVGPSDPPVGPTVDDLVTAIAGISGFESTEPIDVVVDGFRGKEFEVTAPSVPSCNLLTWATRDRTNGVGANEVNLVRILDVDGVRVLMAGAYHPDSDSPSVKSEIDQVFGSIRIGA